MSQFDSVLLTYAHSGLRTIEDWTSRGRRINDGAAPRVDALHRGVNLPLFSLNQTHPKPRAPFAAALPNS